MVIKDGDETLDMNPNKLSYLAKIHEFHSIG